MPVEAFLALSSEERKAIPFKDRVDLYCELMCRNSPGT
jgi:hypothetical protein